MSIYKNIASYLGEPDMGKFGGGSAASFQLKSIAREMRRRGISQQTLDKKESIDWDKEFEDAPADEEGTGRPKRAPDPVPENIPNGKDRRAAIYHSKEEQRHRNAAIDSRIKAVHHTNMANQHRDSRIELLRKHGLVD